MSEPFLKVIDISKRYGDRSIVNRVSFEVGEGEVLALLGPSGSGKTTILRLIAGLDSPYIGEIWISGERVTANGRCLVPSRARGIGFVFQDLALWPHLTVWESSNFVLGSLGVPRAERAKRIDETLKLMRIERFADSYPANLSGGEQQRTALARALVGRPRLLLLDEPMSSLDSALKEELIGELKRLQQQLRITTIHVTHDKNEALVLANRIAVMQEGECRIEPSHLA